MAKTTSKQDPEASKQAIWEPWSWTQPWTQRPTSLGRGLAGAEMGQETGKSQERGTRTDWVGGGSIYLAGFWGTGGFR